MSKQRLLVAAATALTLSACDMFSGMGASRTGTSEGDGGSTGTSSEAVAACKGLTGTALRSCLDRQRLDGGSESRDSGSGS
jgi:hypothetical protein